MPFVAYIVNSFLANSSSRFESRFLRVAEELDAQQKRIQDRIDDKSYYEPEEFQMLLGLVIEKLHTTHDEEKLRMLGDARANSGSRDFQADDKEEYIRVLRDLSTADLRILNDEKLKDWFPHTHTIEYDPEVLSNPSRLVGMGLVIDRLKTKTTSAYRTGSERMDTEIMLRALLTEPPKKSYSLSPFGARFLKFITGGPLNADTK